MKRLPLLLLVAILLFSACCLAACGEDMPAPPESGYSVSGIVTADGEPLAGVTVLIDAEPAGSTDENGVFSVLCPDYGSIVAFEKEGFAFSPDSHTVRGDVNDLHILASPADESDPDKPDVPDTPDEPDVPDVPDIPDEPDEPDVPDVPDVPDIPDEPDEEEPEPPEPLSAAGSFFSCYAPDGSARIAFAADPLSERITLTLSDGESTLSLSADARGEVFASEELRLPFDAELSDTSLSVILDADGAVALFGGDFTLTVTCETEGRQSSVSDAHAFSFAFPAPSVFDLSAEGGVLSWKTEGLPEGCTFAVIASGLIVAETSETSLSLGDIGTTLPEGTLIAVAAVKDGSFVAVSDTIAI